MKAFYFRFLDEDENPSGWIGFAMGKTINDIFDIIDEFGDPYSVQILESQEAGFCVQWKPFPDESGDAAMEKTADLIESMPWVFDEEGWTTPPWSIH